MVKTIQKQKQISATPWVAGFDITDFMVPSFKTPVAEVAAAVSSVVLELGAADTTLNDALFAETQSLSSQSAFLEVLESWGQPETTDYEDFADRKAAWPQIDPSHYAPASSDEQRIVDNIKAIKLLREIQASKRTTTDEDRKVFLKYCGWGGLARVFSPDGSTPHKWAAYRDELAALSSADEFEQMRASITTAYYTDPSVVQAVWELARHLGFKGGRVVEPSAGVGHFLAAMPADMAKRSEITAVELDGISAGLLEANFAPLGVQVHASALEKAKLPVAFYDCVVGNVPFGEFRSLDTSTADYANWSIHNYFLGKSLDMVRPGGLVILITSKHSMDSAKNAHRKWLSAHADLLGAMRLPTMAFKGQANTEAVTDILVFKRRVTPDFSAQNWLELQVADKTMLKPGEPSHEYVHGRHSPRIPKINGYYVANPKNVIGFLEWQSSQYGKVLNPVFDGNEKALGEAIRERIAGMPKDLYEEPVSPTQAAPRLTMDRYRLDNFIAPGTFVEKNGRICVSEGDELLDVDTMYSGTARKRLLGMIAVREKALEVIEFQAKSDDDARLGDLQRELNGTYDAFVAANGYLSTSANSRLMRADPDWPVMLALEIWDDETGTAAKADIFTKRTVGHRSIPEKVDNVKDAMLLSLSLYGKIVLKDVSIRCGQSVAQVVREFKAQGVAYRDPQLARWVPADEYLSGHIREKIAVARAAGPAYAGNIEPLEAVLPADLGPVDVEARLGAPWIPVDVIEEFATQLVGAEKDKVEVAYEAGTASWTVKTSSYKLEWAGDRALQTTRWGTKKRCALELLEAALNQQPPTITMRVDDRQVVDKMATMQAREKWQSIRDEFRAWVYKDPVRTQRLLRIYNDLFNQIVERKYDGEHLTLPGMSMVVTPYSHQKNAIWRVVTNGNTLLAHCVGAGKTLVMCAASMELRRLGKAVKPVHVVQNNCLEQYAAEFVRLYPQARVLIASKEDLSGDKRRTFCARVATGDWDAVIMTQATFERIPMSPGVQESFVRRLMAEARTAANLAEDSGAKRSLKEIEKRMKDLEAKIERLVESSKKDPNCVWFDEMGFDYGFVDEAHAYKNLARISKMPRMAGLGNTASQRSFDVLMKTRYFMDLHDGKEEGVVLATATPLSNSLAELHTMQVYLQPVTLKKFGIYEFDAWSASYGESVTGIELSPDGSGYRMNTRYARFVNLPELMAVFRGVADIKTKRMLKLPTPRVAGGKPQAVVAQPSEELMAIVAELVERAQKIRDGAVQPNEDNMLKVTGDGRKAALDVRLLDPTLPFNPSGKLAIAARNIHRIWHEGNDSRLTQMVFCDLGTPGGAGFNVYDEVKRLLTDLGVPAGQIEYVHDHNSDTAKAKLWKRMREGTTRITLGSTSMMGTGTNAQTLLKAVHQLDAPWRPSDVEQRDGRGERQGNTNEEIELVRYVTEKSFDAYSWNLLDVKARFIEQVMTAESGLRSVEDIAVSALTYAEMKAIASGNPLVLEKAGVDAEVQKLSMMRSHWEDERWQLGQREATLVGRLKWIDTNMAAFEADAKMAALVGLQTEFKPANDLSVEAVKVAGKGPAGIGAALRAHSNRDVLTRSGCVLGIVGGFEVVGVKHYRGTLLNVIGNSGYEMEVTDRPHLNDVEGVGRAALTAISVFENIPTQLRIEYGTKTDELETVRKLLKSEFEHAGKLESLLQRQREIECELDLDKSVAGSDEVAEQAA